MVTNMILREFAPFVQFNCFFITKQYQNKGYGTKLFNYLCKKIKCNSMVNNDQTPCIFVQATGMLLARIIVKKIIYFELIYRYVIKFLEKYGFYCCW